MKNIILPVIIASDTKCKGRATLTLDETNINGEKILSDNFIIKKEHSIPNNSITTLEIK